MLDVDGQGVGDLEKQTIFMDVKCVSSVMSSSSWTIQVNFAEVFPTYFRRNKDIIIIMYKS